jgi:Minimal binding motif of Hap4 for binding to Hap2/3/5
VSGPGFTVRSNQLTSEPEALNKYHHRLLLNLVHLPQQCLRNSHHRSCLLLPLLCGQLVFLLLSRSSTHLFFVHHLSASREWVIPAKPKPGRKPKKDLASTTVQANDVLTYFLIHFGLLKILGPRYQMPVVGASRTGINHCRRF